MRFTTLKQAEAICGKLEQTSKMPCLSHSITALRCKRGSKLNKQKNTICSKCYARKFRYLWDSIQTPLEKKFQALKHPFWVEAMTFLINRKNKTNLFRFFASGDLQGVWHLKNIVKVVKNLPHITFWLPTHEYGFVNQYIKAGNKLPENLVLRLSADLIDGKAPEKLAKRLGVLVSTSKTKDFTCPASLQENSCGDCRKCWDKNTFEISYRLH